MKTGNATQKLSFRAKRGISRSIIEGLEKQILRFAQDDNLGHFLPLACRPQSLHAAFPNRSEDP